MNQILLHWNIAVHNNDNVKSIKKQKHFFNRNLFHVINISYDHIKMDKEIIYLLTILITIFQDLPSSLIKRLNIC